jgi:hypothetical protein
MKAAHGQHDGINTKVRTFHVIRRAAPGPIALLGNGRDGL